MSLYGALDTIGNVWGGHAVSGARDHEPLFKYPYDPADGRENLDAAVVAGVLRGGSFNYGREAAVAPVAIISRPTTATGTLASVWRCWVNFRTDSKIT